MCFISWPNKLSNKWLIAAVDYSYDARRLAFWTKPNVMECLRTYNIGAILTVGNFSYGGSFGSLGKSLTTPEFHKAGRKTDYYTGTVAYKQGPFAASVSYFKSNQFKNTVDAVSIGTAALIAAVIEF